MTFGQKLLKAREEAGLTQEELAQKLYITRQGLSRWENDKTQPSIETLGLICNVLNKSPDYFIEVKEELGRRNYSQLSSGERLVAAVNWRKSRCRFVRLNFFLLDMLLNLGVAIITYFCIQFINLGQSLPLVSGLIGGVLLCVAALISMFGLSYRCAVLYNSYLLSELNVVRTNKLYFV